MADFAARSISKGPGRYADVTRCRLRIVCDGATDDLALRPIRVQTATCPTLCCEACAAASSGQPAEPAVTS